MSGEGILVVEDDESIGSGLERVLASQGYAVRRLTRERPAATAADEDVGLVILDLGLPTSTGSTSAGACAQRGPTWRS